MVRIRGYDIPAFDMKQASSRKALQLKNHILAQLYKLGIQEDWVTVKEEAVVIKRVPAYVSWYMDGQYLFYDAKSSSFMENLFVCSSLIEKEVASVLSGEKSREDFVASFMEDKEVREQRKEARRILGVEESCMDFELMTKKYKDLSKVHHPDMGGDLEVFQRINTAHKTIKRELC